MKSLAFIEHYQYVDFALCATCYASLESPFSNEVGMSSSVRFRFKSARQFETLSFEGDFVKVADLKIAIVQRKKLNCGEGFDLEISDDSSGEGTLKLAKIISILCWRPILVRSNTCSNPTVPNQFFLSFLFFFLLLRAICLWFSQFFTVRVHLFQKTLL